MKSAPRFLSVEHILAVHERVIGDFGGDAGVRDYGLLESAATMPAAAFGGKFLHGDERAMAAAYLFHICRAHPFVDGNKRTALAAAEVFLDLNGFRLAASDADMVQLVLGVAEGKASKDETTAFFRKHCRRRRGDLPQ